eukprot:Gb_37275 [translate_table: standard]
MATSAPKLFKKSNLLVLEVAAIVDAPNTCLASCITRLPTPPAPPSTRMDFPGPKPALSRPSCAVSMARGRLAA